MRALRASRTLPRDVFFPPGERSAMSSSDDAASGENRDRSGSSSSSSMGSAAASVAMSGSIATSAATPAASAVAAPGGKSGGSTQGSTGAEQGVAERETSGGEGHSGSGEAGASAGSGGAGAVAQAAAGAARSGLPQGGGSGSPAMPGSAAAPGSASSTSATAGSASAASATSATGAARGDSGSGGRGEGGGSAGEGGSSGGGGSGGETSASGEASSGGGEASGSGEASGGGSGEGGASSSGATSSSSSAVADAMSGATGGTSGAATSSPSSPSGTGSTTGSDTGSGVQATGSSAGPTPSVTTASTADPPPSISVAGPVCFRPGTRLRTPAGETAIDDLQPGDWVLTADGSAEAVVWIGRQRIRTNGADPLRIAPIRIRAGAMGDGVPQRDLLVSPDHAIGLEGILVHASALVDGVGVLREPIDADEILYLHVELGRHALLLAEGLPAESFVDNLQDLPFDNGAERESLNLAPVAEMPWPRAKSRRQVPLALRQRLAARALALPGAGIAARAA